MRMSRMRVEGLFAVILAAVAVIAGTQHASAQREGVSSKTASELFTERIAVLEQIVRLGTEEYRSGHVEFSMVGRAHTELLEARLAVTEPVEERIIVLRDIIQVAGQLEEMAQQRFRAGDASQLDVLVSRANRLKFEAHLAQERGDGRTRN